MTNKIIVLSGKSGAGKDTIASKLKQLGYNFIVSHTTRPMREGESEANPYFFIDEEQMLKMHDNGELIEMRSYSTEFGTWYYAVHKSQVENNKPYVVVLDIEGLIDFRHQFCDRVISIYIDVADDERESRAKSRGSFDQAEWDRRLVDDAIKFSQKQVSSHCDHVLYNDDVDLAVETIISHML